MVVSEQNLIPEYYIKLKFCSFRKGVEVVSELNPISEGRGVVVVSKENLILAGGGGGQWAKPHYGGRGWWWSVSKTSLWGGWRVVVVRK